MNRRYSLVYKISHLNKISRSNILNKALRQPRAGLMFLGRRLRHTGTEKNVTCSERHHGLQKIDAGDLNRELITQPGCHGVF